VVPIEWEEVRIGDVLTQRKTLQCVSKDAPLLSFTIEEGVGIDDDDVFVAYYMFNPNTQTQQNS
jgi:hypothetical protein